MFGSLIDPASVVGQFMKPFNTAADGFKSAMNAAEGTVKLGVGIVNAIGSVGEVLVNNPMPNPVPSFKEMQEGFALQKSTIPENSILNEAIKPSAPPAPPAPPAQGGGSSSLNALPYTLLGTIVLIALSGFVATYYRSKKHVTRTQQDDTPPEPGVFRKPDSKEHAA